jgi:hypothetical protein
MTYDERLQRGVELTAWETPDYYGGHDPIGDYMIYSQTRDSDILIRCNYDLIFADLKDKAADLNCSDKVYDFRASHWGCGWVEIIIVEKDAPTKFLEFCEDIKRSLDNYHVYDGCEYSDREYQEINDYWRDLSLRERIEIIVQFGRENTPIFAARHDYYPDDYGVYEYLREGL